MNRKERIGSLILLIANLPENRLEELEHLVRNLGGKEGQFWHDRLVGFHLNVASWLPPKEEDDTSNSVGFVKLISGGEVLELDETDGKETIAKAKDTFPGWIDPDFKAYGCDMKSEPTKKTRVSVHEMIKPGTFAQIFNGMSDDLNSLCLTQSQIIQFVQKHRKWLRTEGCGTLFLFKVGKGEDDELFIARAYFGDDGLLVIRVNGLSYDRVWDARHRRRVVVPQLNQ
jgi:hypothetical protein